jgi:hypothetical protein
MNESAMIAAAAGAIGIGAWSYVQLCRIVHAWDEEQGTANKELDRSAGSDKMLWTAPLGDGTKSKGESIFPPPPPSAGEPFYTITVHLPEAVYLTPHLHWTSDLSRAARFEFMTTAIAFAELSAGLNSDEYVIEYHAKVEV